MAAIALVESGGAEEGSAGAAWVTQALARRWDAAVEHASRQPSGPGPIVNPPRLQTTDEQPPEGFEPSTYALRKHRSTAELRWQDAGQDPDRAKARRAKSMGRSRPDFHSTTGTKREVREASIPETLIPPSLKRATMPSPEQASEGAADDCNAQSDRRRGRRLHVRARDTRGTGARSVGNGSNILP